MVLITSKLLLMIIQELYSDNGIGFVNSQLKTIFHNRGILHKTPCVNTPQQNRRIECKHHHILDVACALRFQASLSLSLWGSTP
ncbi:hypothetical protein CR513_16160, partial [Mucuna pruriens]